MPPSSENDEPVPSRSDPGEKETRLSPIPIDTSSAILPSDVLENLEALAENAHNAWATRRLKEGWNRGDAYDIQMKTHPLLVPYEQLPELEKVRLREMVLESLKSLFVLGYRIEVIEKHD